MYGLSRRNIRLSSVLTDISARTGSGCPLAGRLVAVTPSVRRLNCLLPGTTRSYPLIGRAGGI